LIVGIGDIGENVLEMLARVPRVSKVYAGGRDEEKTMPKICSAFSGALHQGYYPKVDFLKLDLDDTANTAKALQEIEPDVIVSATSLKTWWVPQSDVPRDVFKKLDEAGFGPWLPFHLTLIYKLMKAVKKAKITTHVVNCSVPDAVNAILGKIGMDVTVGIGNCDLFIPWLNKIVADKYKVSTKDVCIHFVGHHYLCHVLGAFKSTCGCPYYLKITVNGKEVTDQFNLDELLVDANRYMPKGQADHFIVAASTVKDVMCILDDTNELTYAVGPEGLPGGYPARLSRSGARIDLPDGLTRKEAIRINEESQKFDGIERIENDGTVVFTKNAAKIMDDLLGYKCEKLRPEESERRATELSSAYDKFVSEFRQRKG
jgi:hypothetical protein